MSSNSIEPEIKNVIDDSTKSKIEIFYNNTQETIEKGALGFGNCQLLLSLYHNTPNNTLPIIWFDEDNQLWSPIFKRYNKVY